MGIDDNFATPQERAEHFRKLLASRNTELTPDAESRFDSDLVPDIEQNSISEEAQRLEDFVQGIDILEAYRKFINKMDPQPRGNSREVHISCPIPGHVDNNPSAWANVDTKTWYCGGCGIGGDIYDLAAIGLGYSWPGSYKTKDEFPKLKKDLAESFGLVVHTSPLTGNTTILTPVPDEADEETDERQEPEVEATPAPASPNLTLVKPLPVPDPVPNVDINNSDIFIDWEAIVPGETFLREWIKANAIDHIPHEYHFWTGLLAVGLAGGHKNYLTDRKPVKGNLYVCIYGPTGIGKSQAIEPLDLLLREAAPWQEDLYSDPEGIKIIPAPSSGEALIDSFFYEVKDTSTQKRDHLAPVVGLLKQNEFSELIKKSERVGSSMKEVLINMYDAGLGQQVTTHARGSGVKEADSPFCSLLSTTQPGAVHTFLRNSDVESGTLNRFIYADGHPRTEPMPFHLRSPDITTAIDYYKKILTWSYAGHEFHIQGTSAELVWTDFFNRELKPIKSGAQQQDSIYARIDLTLKKLIVLFCLNEHKTEPDADMMRRILKIYPYLRLTYSIFAGDLVITEQGQLETKIKEICMAIQADSGKPASMRDIVRRVNKKWTSEDIARGIKNLISINELEEVVVQGKRGPATTRYQYIA